MSKVYKTKKSLKVNLNNKGNDKIITIPVSIPSVPIKRRAQPTPDEKILIYLDSLPKTVKSIDISGEKLTKLPDLTRFKLLQELNCSYNNITCIIGNEFQSKLKILYCNNNKLTRLFKYDKTSKCENVPRLLRHLNCSHNYLEELFTSSNIPKFLKYLLCDNNKISEIFSMGIIPKKILYIASYNNCITRIPNIIHNNKYLINLRAYDGLFNPIYNSGLLKNYPKLRDYPVLNMFSFKENINYITTRNKKLDLEKALTLAKERMAIINKDNCLILKATTLYMHPKNIQKLINIGYSPDEIYDSF